MHLSANAFTVEINESDVFFLLPFKSISTKSL